MVSQQINWTGEPLGFELLEGGEESTNDPILEAEQIAEAPAPQPSRFPEMIDGPYTGTASVTSGRPKLFELKVVLQTKTGDLGGTAEFQDSRRRQARQFQFQGALNRDGVFVLNGTGPGASVAIISGTVARDGRTIVGNYVVKAPGEPLEAGTFTAQQNDSRNSAFQPVRVGL